METSGVLTSFATAVRGKCPGLLYIGKRGREMKKIAGCMEKTAVILPMSSPHRVGLLAEICWTKSHIVFTFVSV